MATSMDITGMEQPGAQMRDGDGKASTKGSSNGSRSRKKNVAQAERLISTAAGGALMLTGLRQRGWRGLGVAAVGGALLRRGVTGHCPAYSAMGVSTQGGRLHASGATVDAAAADRVERSVTIERPRAALYATWRDFSRLPSFMDNLERVDVLSPTRSHWVAKAPAGTSAEWDAEITEERENELIAWRSVEPADIPNRGWVRFADAPGDRGTTVTVSIEFDPPAGEVGRAVARLFGDDPEQAVRNALRRFKQVTEAGEVPTTEGQASGREKTTKTAKAARAAVT